MIWALVLFGLAGLAVIAPFWWRAPSFSGRADRERLVRHSEYLRSLEAEQQREFNYLWSNAFGRPRLTIIQGGKADEEPPAGETT